MTEDQLDALCKEIAGVLSGQPLGMTQRDIHMNCELAGNATDTAQAIRRMLERDEITREPSGAWRLKKPIAGRVVAEKAAAAPPASTATTKPPRNGVRMSGGPTTKIGRILACLGDRQLTAEEIAAETGISASVVANNLYAQTNARKHGLTVVGKRGRASVYAVGAVSRETAPTPKEPPAQPAPQPERNTAGTDMTTSEQHNDDHLVRRSAPRALKLTSTDATCTVLERAMVDAERALKDYLDSVCDKEILHHLQQMRDSAAAAWRRHVGAPA